MAAKKKKTARRKTMAVSRKTGTVKTEAGVKKQARDNFLICGIGSSAGGLNPMEAFLRHVPEKCGIAFVVVSHHKADHASLLSQLLQRDTDMPVVDADDGMVVEPDHVYVSPPGKDMVLKKGILQLRPATLHKENYLPIDSFFRSLAADRHENAAGIVLSGTGSDGTLGLIAIKAESGLVMAHSLNTAEYPGMPESAILNADVDFILPPEEMPPRLLDYAKRNKRKPATPVAGEKGLSKTRRELERTQEEYASLYEYAPVGYMSLYPDGRIRRLNIRAADLLGRPRQGLVGTSLRRCIVEADLPIFQQKIRLALDSSERHSCELRLLRPNGNAYIHFECQMAAPERAEPDLLRVAMTDISQRVAVEERLRISRQQLEAALAASRCGLWDWPNVDNDEAWWSPEFYQLLGYPDGAIRPGYDTFQSLLHPDDQDRVTKALDSHIQRGQPFDEEYRLRTSDGDYRWFRGHGQVIRSVSGSRRMAGLIQDITEKHEIEATLRQAVGKAEQANREKTQFLAAASHDLRQPLQSLSLYLSSLQLLPGTAESKELIAKMRQSVQTMGQLLRTLLNLSRLDAGIIEPELTAFPVSELFSDILVTNGPSAKARGLSLRVHSCDCVVFSDRGLLQEIVLNFVTNALRNTDRGGILIGCRRRGDKARIQVSDTGIGIPPDKLPSLLDPHAVTLSVGKTRNSDTIRTGLGLSIVRQIAGVLGYQLYAISVPGRGSMFAVEAPLAQASVTVQDTSADVVVKPPPVDGHLTLLLVDNDPDIVEAFRSAAAATGHRLACANTADEALTQVQEGLRPDAIICDLRLRRVPGTETIRQLRQALGEKTPAVLLTGDTSIKRTEVQTLTHCRVLYKPVDFEVLTRTIEELLPGN